MKRFISCLLIFALVVTGLPDFLPINNGMGNVQAASIGKTLKLSTAKSLAMAKSKQYRKIKNKISVKKAKYQSAVKSLQLKRKNLRSFRYSPLLSFKFPQALDQTEEYEYQYKPLSIQSEITDLQHQLSDTKYEVYDQITNLYVTAYTLQESIKFNEERLENLKETLARNKARLAAGEATKSDIESMEKSISNLESKIGSEKRSFEATKSDIKDMIGLDITSGYNFENPYLQNEILRSDLPNILKHTLENDQGYYSARLNSNLLLYAVDIDYSLLRNKWGGRVNRINSYIVSAKNGWEIDEEAFKEAYRQVVDSSDSPWNGYYFIYFFFFSVVFPKEWLKGERDGSRYVEDDPYLLYNNVLEYVSALEDEKTTLKNLTKSVNTGFETLVTKRNTYEKLLEQVEKSKSQVQQATLRNSLGDLTYAELSTLQKEYEDLENDMLTALADYTKELADYDRLTCGAIDNLIAGNVDLDSAVGGDSYLVDEGLEGAYYYFKTLVSDNMFELSIYIPDDFSIEITDFELWCDGKKIGDRTAVNNKLRHLAISDSNVDVAKIRLFNNGKFVDEVEIDPTRYNGPLEINGGYHVETVEESSLLASYTIRTNDETGICTLTITPADDKKDIKAYKLTDKNGNSIYSNAPVDIKTSTNYLGLLSTNLTDVSVEFYGETDTLIYKGYFDTANLEINKEEE